MQKRLFYLLRRRALPNFEEPYRAAEGPTYIPPQLPMFSHGGHTGHKEPIPTQINPKGKGHPVVIDIERVLGTR